MAIASLLNNWRGLVALSQVYGNMYCIWRPLPKEPREYEHISYISM